MLEVNWRGFTLPWIYTVDGDLVIRPSELRPGAVPFLRAPAWNPLHGGRRLHQKCSPTNSSLLAQSAAAALGSIA